MFKVPKIPKPSFLQEKLKKGSLLLFLGVLLLLLTLFGLKILFKKAHEMPILQKSVEFHSVTENLDDKSQWIFDAQTKLKEQAKEQEELKAELKALKDKITAEDDAKEEEMDQTSIKPTHLPASNGTGQAGTILSDSWTSQASIQAPNVKSHIPSGSYAKAVLLSGVNVSAGVNSQGMPQPVLLRLVHKGSLPNKFFGRMKNCRLTAAVHGDLSSERAFMRLEKLSCVKPDGEIISINVAGYVTGEDGANGMRGRVVTRDAEILKRGFVSGLLSGMAKGVSQSFTSQSISPFGTVTTNTAKSRDVFKQSGAEGASNAFELMARYSIQRAEQYQPVIQVDAGRTVYVVFQDSVKFDGHYKMISEQAGGPNGHQ